MQNHISLNLIDDVLNIPDLSERYMVCAEKLTEKIKFFEKHGFITHDKYFDAMNKARNLMLELQSKSDFIHYNDF